MESHEDVLETRCQAHGWSLAPGTHSSDGAAYQRTGAAPSGPRRRGRARRQMARKRAVRESARCPLVRRNASVYRIALGRSEAARAIDRRRDAACSEPADRQPTATAQTSASAAVAAAGTRARTATESIDPVASAAFRRPARRRRRSPVRLAPANERGSKWRAAYAVIKPPNNSGALIE